MKKFYIGTLMAFLFLMAFLPSKAAEEIYFNELRGTAIAPGSTMYVTDEKFKTYSSLQWGALNNIDVKNFISFELNTDTSLFFYNKPFEATLNVTIHFFADKSDTSLETSPPQTMDLIVRFDTAKGSLYKGMALFKFQGAYKFKVVVNSISSPQFSGTPPPVFRLLGKSVIQRQYPFEDVSTDVSVFQFPTTHKLNISWTPAHYPGAEWFDVEWMTLDSLSQAADYIRSTMSGGLITDAIPADTLAKWFRHNASRITTAASNYTLNLAYNSGFLVYRIRGVQIHYPDSIRYEGNWNYQAASAPGGTSQKSIVQINWHQSNLNWQYAASFAEEGKRKEVIQYFDGSLRNRQAVTLDNSNETAVVQESVYDSEGRAAASILPAPVNSNLLKYYPAFNVNNSGKPYSFSDIAYNLATCTVTPAPLGTSSGASGYYSSSNSFSGILHKDFIPSAEGLPISVTEFTPDNTGRVSRQGGVGPSYQPGSGHETRYFYGKPNQMELDRMFGSEAGKANHYLKNMVVDPNGTISISYVNSSGKTVATALAGESPDSLGSPTSFKYPDYSLDRSTLLETEDFRKDISSRSLSADATFTVSMKGDHIFTYSLYPQQLLVQARPTFNELILCNTCHYDLKIEVKDNCNQLLMAVNRPAGTVFSTAMGAPVPIIDSFQLNIATIGEYYVRYSFEISGNALNYYDSVNLAQNTNIRGLASFITEELKNMDLSSCFNNCQTCDEELGTQNDFLNRFRVIYANDSIPFIEADSIYLTQLYAQKRIECDLARSSDSCAKKIDPCSEKLDLIKIDVSPGGQYALFDTISLSLTGPSDINVLSKYTLVSSFPNENGLPDTVVLKNINGEDSVRLAPNQLSLRDFIFYFKDSWADSLAPFHPEYCYYKRCQEETVYRSFDEFVKNGVDTGEEAVTESLYSFTDPIALLRKDPFFAPAKYGGDSSYFKQMRDSLLLYSRSMVGYSQSDKHILDIVKMLVYCSTNASPWDGCQVEDSCRSINREWDIYKQLYMNMKEGFYEKARLASPAYANCRNCYIGTDIIGMVLTDTTIGGLNEPQHDDFGTYTPNVNCVNSCAGDAIYYDYTRPGVSYYVFYSTRNVPPSSVPSGYTNGRFYSGFTIMSGPADGCNFFNVWVYIKDETIIGVPVTPPPSVCTSDTALVNKYKDKQRRFPEYVSAGNLLRSNMANNGTATNTQVSGVLTGFCATDCDTRADAWVSSLLGCVNSGDAVADSLKIDSLRKAFVAICLAGCDGGSRGPAMTAPASAPLPYHSFEEAIIAIIGPGAITTSCAVELLSDVYPYDKQPVPGIQTIYESSYEICSKLSEFRSAFTGSGFSGSFYQYLNQEIGKGFFLSPQQFTDLERSCNGCSPVVRSEIGLPVAFTTGRRVAISCTTADSLKTAFLAKFPTVEPNTYTYDVLFKNFCNQTLGFSLGYEDYYQYFDSVCAVAPGSLVKLYDDVQLTEVSADPNSCVANAFLIAYQNALLRYDAYIDSVRADFREAYLNRCMNPQAKLGLGAWVRDLHHTLYYYDQAGNLVKTIPPEGVSLLTELQTDTVRLNRLYEQADCYLYTDELDFNGTGAKAFVGREQYRMGTNQGITFEARVWFNNLNDQGIFSYYDSSLRQGYRVYLKNQQLVFELAQSEYISDSIGRVYGENKGMTADLTGVLPLNEWVHIGAVMRRKGREAATYPFITMNGMALNMTHTANADYRYYRSCDPDVVTTPVVIGGDQKNYLYFSGKIKQVRLYKRALDIAELRQNFTNICQVPMRQDAMVFWSVMNEGRGQIRNRQNIDSSFTVGAALSWITNRKGIFPAHTLATTYVYNSLNQVVKQTTPDAGESRFWYDRLGRLVASQNSEQLAPDGTGNANRYSYTRYDLLGRIVEVGEKEQPSMQLDTMNTLNDGLLQSWLNSGSNYQVTRTLYDAVNDTMVTIPGITQYQQYLRKRVVATLYKDTAAAAGYTNATHYSYDINGNVKTLWQEIGALRAYTDNGIKKIDYEYDLVSGKVNQVYYQAGKGDQFMYRYRYDAENRLTGALSSRDGLLWQTDAEYRYYLHGPLARVELGTRKVQGVDYAYTLQGWLKGMNTTNLLGQTAVTGDMGGDALQGSRISRDVAGFALHYNHDDYKGIGTHARSFAALPGMPVNSLYNGNIAAMSVGLNNMQPLFYNYGYDVLNRLLSKRTYSGLDTSNHWTPVLLPDYLEYFNYDANGNILNATRKATAANGGSLDMDALTYHYQLNTNKLTHVTDTVSAGAHAVDIDNQAPDNYSYDKIGNLIADQSEGITAINWTVYGKIRNISKTGTQIRYAYDAGGNRVHKQVTGTGATEEVYIRDAQGNALAIYRIVGGVAEWQEQHLYGSSRLGMMRYGGAIPAAAAVVNSSVTTLVDSVLYGRVQYELSNHLGNVLAVVSDKKIGVSSLSDSSLTDHYVAEVLSLQDYYAFGMGMPGRGYQFGSYRYGFNGKENDGEVKGEGNQQDYGMRIYDPRVGKFLSVDPKAHKLPGWSPYAYGLNNPILMIDPDGALPWPIHFRSFISASSVGGGLFRGDGRGPSLSTASSITSRVNLSFTYDPSTKKISNRDIYSDPTVFYGAGVPGTPTYLPPQVKAADPNFTMTSSIWDFNKMNPNLESSRSMFGFKYDAKDPVTPGFATPSLDVHSNLIFDENVKKGTLTIMGKVFGDEFPSTEAFIVDQSGKGKIFLGAIKENGGVGDLYGDNKLDLFNINMTINFDKKGNFTGIKQGDKTYTVEEWNKRISEGWDKKQD